jgi:DNA-binding response OmpR family regulator
MNVWDIARYIRQSWPQLPVGLILGWAEKAMTREERQRVDLVVTKPFDGAQLGERLGARIRRSPPKIPPSAGWRHVAGSFRRASIASLTRRPPLLSARQRSQVRHELPDLLIRQMVAEGGHAWLADGRAALLHEAEEVVV